MKTKYIMGIGCLMMLSSCFKDDGNYSYSEVNDIVIEGLNDRYEVLVSQPLRIPITLKTAYTDMAYEWYVFDPKEEEKYGHDETYQATLIGTDEDLLVDDVDWNTGVYTVLVKAISKANGYAVTAKTSVEVTTELSRGFYVLKETADGATELDLYNKEQAPVLPNLFQNRLGESLKGKPAGLGVLYGHGYIDDATKEMITCNTVAVSTEAGTVSFFRTDNFLPVHDEKDIRYGGLQPGEIPLAGFTFGLSNFFVTNQCVAGTYASSESMGSTGIFGTTSGNGASRFIVQEGNMLLIYWDAQHQCFDYLDQFTFGHGFYGAFDNNGFSTAGMECVSCGSSWASSTLGVLMYFLLKDEAGKKYMYFIDTNMGAPMIADVVELDAESKFARATQYATNGQSATFVYYVYQNQLYAFNLDGRQEDDNVIQLEGMGSGETITYLSYQYMDSQADSEYNFAHLVVGTQQGNTYKVYMYDIEAGLPKKLIRSFSGQGQLKSVNYISPKHEASGGSVSIPNGWAS